MALHCRICGFSKFRTSRFRIRLHYFVQLLFLRLPVRCLNCDERAFTFLNQYLEVRRERKEHHREQNGTA